MANKLLWLPEGGVTLLSTELNNLADGAFAVDSSSYANQTNKYRWGSFMFLPDDFDAAPDAGGVFELHLFYKIDGTLYADGYDGDGDADSVPGPNTYVDSFVLSAADADQYLPIMGVPLYPFEFKAAVVNECGQDLTAVDTHLLKMFAHDEELQ